MTDERPSAQAAKDELYQAIQAAQSHKENPPTWEVAATQQKLDELARKAFPNDSAKPVGPTRSVNLPTPMASSPPSNVPVVQHNPESLWLPTGRLNWKLVNQLLGPPPDPRQERMLQEARAFDDRYRRGIR